MDLEIQQELNKHTAAIVNAIATFGRTSVFEMNFIEQQQLQANVAMENWTKQLHDNLKEILGEDHYVLINFREKWKITAL